MTIVLNSHDYSPQNLGCLCSVVLTLMQARLSWDWNLNSFMPQTTNQSQDNYSVNDTTSRDNAMHTLFDKSGHNILTSMILTLSQPHTASKKKG